MLRHCRRHPTASSQGLLSQSTAPHRRKVLLGIRWRTDNPFNLQLPASLAAVAPGWWMVAEEGLMWKAAQTSKKGQGGATCEGGNGFGTKRANRRCLLNNQGKCQTEARRWHWQLAWLFSINFGPFFLSSFLGLVWSNVSYSPLALVPSCLLPYWCYHCVIAAPSPLSVFSCSRGT